MPWITYKAFIFVVDGESMYRTLRDNEKIFVEQQHLRDIRELHQSRIYVVEHTDGTFYIKRCNTDNDYTELKMSSDNHSYNDIILPLDEVKRMWKMKNMFKWDGGFMEDMEGIDTTDEEIGLNLDKKAVEDIQRKDIEFNK